MFAKDKVSQSMIDAVNSVLEKSENPNNHELILCEGLSESEAGQKLKATASSLDRMMRNAKVNTTMVHNPKKAKQYVDGIDGVRRELSGGAGDNQHFSTKVQLKSEDVSTDIVEVLDTDAGINSYLNKSTKKRSLLAATGKLGDDSNRRMNKSYKGTHKAIDKLIDRSARNESLSFSEKILEAMAPVSTPDFSEDDGSMTAAQTKKKEDIVLSMKSKEKDFKKKYGKNWQNVMYATATKMAMAESSDEHIDEAKTPIDDNVPFVTTESGTSNAVSKIKQIAKRHKSKMGI